MANKTTSTTGRSKISIKTIVILSAIVIVLVAGVIVGITYWQKKDTAIPRNFKAEIDEYIKFYIVLQWDAVQGAEAYNVEYVYSISPSEVTKERTPKPELVIDRKRGVLKFRVQSVISGKESPYSEWATGSVAPLELRFGEEPKLIADSESDNTYFLILPLVYYEKYNSEVGVAQSFEIQEKLPSDTDFRQSTLKAYQEAGHRFTLPQDEKGIFVIRVRTLNYFAFMGEHLPKELYELYESSDWIEVSINIP